MRTLLIVAAVLCITLRGADAADNSRRVGVFSNDQLGGLWVTVARNGTNFVDRLRESAKICNVSSSMPLEIASGPTTDTHAPPPWSVSVEQGQCACIARPASLFVHNVGAGQSPFSGTYQWLNQKACNPGPAPATLPAAPSGGEKMEARCGPLTPAGDVNAAICRASLAVVGRKRICFDDGWVHVSAGNPYPPRFVTLFLDGKLYRTPAVQYDIRWSYIAKGCIDVSGVQNVWFNVVGDSSFSAANVEKIVVSVHTRF